MAPLSIVMTSIYMSTATAVFVTPLLSLLLMVYSITQIVVAPIAAGRLTCKQSSLLALALANKFFKDPLVAVHPAIFVS
ncbi:hypothetical protein NC653_001312 [Populus alba x Populus x berolinensis]|uniref:Uncharacterized protein n=1 Tax=Populus alba x Populus x berolinensis TaxID=444605 RepID=A0AAD6RLT7_9ROSI|nr:hypothetical protein NC653_001312 [Populus alba x Populus x berolinensis]